jgi:hypothetical protein
MKRMKKIAMRLVVGIFWVSVAWSAFGADPEALKKFKTPKQETPGPSSFALQGDRARAFAPGAMEPFLSESVPVRLFFTMTGYDNPVAKNKVPWVGPTVHIPNWYYYWSQGVMSRLSDFIYRDKNGFIASFDPDSHLLFIGPGSVSKDGAYYGINKISKQRFDFPGAEGAALCALSISHELKHKEIHDTVPNYNHDAGTKKPPVDTDGDSLPDQYELSSACSQYSFSEKDADTYNLGFYINSEYYVYGDEEFLARMAEKSPVSFDKTKDWSDTGENHTKSLAMNPGSVLLPGDRVSSGSLSTADSSRTPVLSTTATLTDLVQAYRTLPYVMGIDAKPAQKLEIIRKCAAIGDSSAKAFLMDLVDTYWANGPQCSCDRCGEFRLYPWHDAEYSLCFREALLALARWVEDDDVQFVYDKISQDIEGIRNGEIRAAALRCLLSRRFEKQNPSMGNTERIHTLVGELGRVGVCAPEERYVLDHNVGKMTWKMVQNRAIEDLICECDPVAVDTLKTEQKSSAQAVNTAQTQALERAIQILERKKDIEAFRRQAEKNRNGN